jgi:hypothetical protein
LKILQGIDFLTIQTTHHFSLASVINYDLYQSQDFTHDTPDDTQTTNERHSNDTQTTLPNKDKKVKKVKNTQARAWPSNFSLTDEKKKYAIEGGINEEKVDLFWADFKDWAGAKGATYKDWDAAFRMRVRKAPEFGKQFLGGNGNRAPFDIEKEKQRIGTELTAKRFEKFKRGL